MGLTAFFFNKFLQVWTPDFFFRAFYLFRDEKENEFSSNKEKVLFIPCSSQHSLHTVEKLRFCVLGAVTVFLLTLY